MEQSKSKLSHKAIIIPRALISCRISRWSKRFSKSAVSCSFSFEISSKVSYYIFIYLNFAFCYKNNEVETKERLMKSYARIGRSEKIKLFLLLQVKEFFTWRKQITDNTKDWNIFQLTLQKCDKMAKLIKGTLTNADLKIRQYLCLPMKIICLRCHIKTPFTFWDMCTWGMLKVCL